MGAMTHEAAATMREQAITLESDPRERLRDRAAHRASGPRLDRTAVGHRRAG